MEIGSEARDHRVIEAEDCGLVDLTHQVVERKAEAEREMHTMKRPHQAKW
jgi:hypothetical protein